MEGDDRNKLNRLEELKNKLFSRGFETKIEHRDGFSREHKESVMDSWKIKEREAPGPVRRFFMHSSMFKKFFFISIAFFILTVVYASYTFFAGSNTVSNDNIDISVIGNNFTPGGTELPLIAGITNRNSSELQLADLVLEYPKGGGTDLSADTDHQRISLGTIPAGGVRNENVKILLFGEQGAQVPVKISLEYRVAGSNAIFVKDKLYQVNISSTPINLTVDSPQTLSPNQSITLNVKAILNATAPLPKVLIHVDYPVGFQFTSSVPAPSYGNNVWSLGDLAPGGEHDISISGKMIDVFDGDQKTFNVSTGSQSASDKSKIDVVMNAVADTLLIKKPFLAADISINGVNQREYAIDTKTPITARIAYSNNLDTKVDSVKIVAKLSGNAFNRKTIVATGGFYDSAADTITWDQNSDNDLAEVNPGDSGVVNFSFSPLTLYDAGSGILSNPIINIEVDISGSQPSTGFSTDQLNNSSSVVIRVISDLGFSAKALYYSGPFTNTGPVPPKVGVTTTYTVTWSLTNTANNISSVHVNSILPPWVDFVGPVSPDGENLTYNSGTKEVVWNAGSLTKGAGITGAVRSASFQVSFNPSLSQVSSSPLLTNEAVLTGHDDFANVDLKTSKAGVTTNLVNDITLPQNGGVVVN